MANQNASTIRGVRTPQEAREQGANRLLHSSMAHAYDPLVEIDWATPPVPDLLYVPEHRASLYGTPLWDSLSLEQRVELTKHEVASIATTGIWFETILMQLLLRAYYDQDPTSRHAQYALTEVADECRHSIMFGRMIEAFGVGPYPVTGRDRFLGRLLAATGTGPHMFAAILVAEEILDTLQREASTCDSVQPLVRMVSRIHVVEEARHVRYAREELRRLVAETGPVAMAYSRMVIARSAYSIVNNLYQPAIYRSVGIAPAEGRRAVRGNPNVRETMRFAGRRVVAYLSELDLIGGPGVLLWRRCGLM